MVDHDSSGDGAATRAADSSNPQRVQAFKLFGAAIAVVAVGYGLYEWFIGSRLISTDNAYVSADVGQVTPLVAAAVLAVPVVDSQAVNAGDVLVQLDPADAQIAVAIAEADFARATRRVQQTLATGSALSSQVKARNADIARSQARVVTARSTLARASVDLERRKALAAGGAVSGEELSSARNAFDVAQAELAAAEAELQQATSTRSSAEGQFAANDALVRGTSVDTNPEVQAARARLEQARLDLARTTIRAPFAGVIANRSVQVGQRVAPGTPLMMLVPLEQAFVNANYKEVQLERVRVGQPVELTSDLYGSSVVYHGRVVGFSAGTGAAFALIPAQNATGNWIKVVQRVPVRIALDPKELQAHPLRVGLSMRARIDTRERG